ncbi:MAG: hypothetical protein K8H90_02465, partial [Thermoanaerobaculia bacterium]|nr:hypothetical protein [Thermoanaerobaculia bacterium]
MQQSLEEDGGSGAARAMNQILATGGRMTTRSAAMLLIGAVFSAQLAATDLHPNTARGFQPDQSYDVNGLDAVNLFNGNLTLAIPIGQTFSVNGGLSYGLTLTYNAQLWEADQISLNRVAVFPSRTWNAGLGWQLTLGRLLAPNSPENPTDEILYLGPDGSRHKFFDRLHDADDEDPGDSSSVQRVRYSRDSSYLRLREPDPLGLVWSLDFPNGETHSFDVQGRLIAITDRFLNAIYIDYSTDLSGNDVWTIDDGHRTHVVQFRSETLDGLSLQVVDRVDLAAFGGNTATYTFAYVSEEIRRACPETDSTTPDTFTAPFLTSVTFPDGSTFSMPVATSYLLEVPLPPEPECKLSGVLKRIALPTFGALEWDFRIVSLPEESVDEDDGDLRRQFSRAVAVKSRRTVKETGVTEGEWHYIHALTPPPPLDPPSREKRTTVISPSGDKTVHYFSVWPEMVGDTGGWDYREYGLPLTHFAPDAASGLWLSAQTFDCDANPENPLAPLNCESEARTFVGYERDVDSPPFAWLEDAFYFNQRLLASRTYFDSDGGKFTESRSSDFDGYGHFRTMTKTADFDAGNNRVETATFNSETGTYPTAFVQRSFGAAWLLGLFDATQVTENGDTARSEFSFDSNTGFLECVRRLRSGVGRNGHDILVKYTATAEGNRAAESHFGGDDVTLLETGTCEDSGALTPKYRREFEYAYGSLRSAKFAGATSNDTDLDIDPSTGLPSTSR